MSDHLSRQFADFFIGIAKSEPPYMGERKPADFNELVKHMRRFALLADDYVRALAETLYGEPLRNLRHGSQWERAVSDAIGDLIADARKEATCPPEPEDEEYERDAA